jgi:hypothetical protein
MNPLQLSKQYNPNSWKGLLPIVKDCTPAGNPLQSSRLKSYTISTAGRDVVHSSRL